MELNSEEGGKCHDLKREDKEEDENDSEARAGSAREERISAATRPGRWSSRRCPGVATDRAKTWVPGDLQLRWWQGSKQASAVTRGSRLRKTNFGGVPKGRHRRAELQIQRCTEYRYSTHTFDGELTGYRSDDLRR